MFVCVRLYSILSTRARSSIEMARRGSGLDCGLEDPGSISGIPSPRVGRRLRRPGARVRVGSAS